MVVDVNCLYNFFLVYSREEWFWFLVVRGGSRLCNEFRFLVESVYVVMQVGMHVFFILSISSSIYSSSSSPELHPYLYRVKDVFKVFSRLEYQPLIHLKRILTIIHKPTSQYYQNQVVKAGRIKGFGYLLQQQLNYKPVGTRLDRQYNVRA